MSSILSYFLSNNYVAKIDYFESARQMNKMHREYSNCMGLIIDSDGMSNSEVKSCKYVCLQYWDNFRTHYGRHHGAITTVELNEYKQRHQRFIEYVTPILTWGDKLEYNLEFPAQ